MLRGFREFVFRGNLVDLAVAVAIGLAFVTLIGAFTTSLINPMIAAVGPADSFGLGFQIRDANPNTFVDIGAVITAIITFVITAAVIYFAIVVPMSSITARVTKDPDIPAEVPPDVALLTEIRDLLRAQRSGGTQPPAETA